MRVKHGPGRAEYHLPLPSGRGYVKVYEGTVRTPHDGFAAGDRWWGVAELCSPALTLDDLEGAARALLGLARQLRHPEGVTASPGVPQEARP